jgi:hypothetical protein
MVLIHISHQILLIIKINLIVASITELIYLALIIMVTSIV